MRNSSLIPASNLRFFVFSDPSDPISPKDNPTRVPYPPKHTDGKDSHNNDVLEKTGEIISSGKVEDLLKLFGIWVCTIVQPAKCRLC